MSIHDPFVIDEKLWGQVAKLVVDECMSSSGKASLRKMGERRG